MSTNAAASVRFLSMRTYTDKTVSCSVSTSEDLTLTQKDHYHNFYQIYYITKGSLMHSVNGHFVRLTRGDCFIIPPAVTHRIEIDPATSGFYSFSFYDTFLLKDEMQQSIIQRLFSDLTPNGILGRLTLTPEETIRMDGLMRFAKEEFDGAQLGFECILSAILTSILVLLARAYEREECDFKHNNAVLTSIEYIKQHYSEPLLARDLANRVFLSEATFYRVFKRATGQSFKSYLTMVRIRSACSLLKKRAIPITQVAYQCGYGNYSSFYRAFYQQMQMSPIQYLQEG